MKGRRVREKGKARLSQYFKKLEEGDKVSLKVDSGFRVAFPKRLKGSSGKVLGMRGTHAVVEIKDRAKAKTYIIHPIHLRRIK